MIRVGRIVGGIVLVLVAIVALLVGATFTALRTGWGSDLATRLVLPRINALIAGDFEIGRFKFGGDRVTLERVLLRGEDAEIVGRVRRVDVTFSPTALFRGHLAIGAVEIEGPSLSLKNDAAGLNLARALAPKHPRAAAPVTSAASPAGGLAFDLGRLHVSDGRVEIQSPEGAGLPTAIQASDIMIDASAHGEEVFRVFAAEARVSATMDEPPLPAPVALRLSGHRREDQGEAALTATIGDAVIAVTLSAAGPDRVSARVTRAHLTPELVRALLPTVGLRIPLDLTLEARRDGAAVTFATTLDGVAGSIEARGTFDATALRAREIDIGAKNIDLGRAFEGFPDSDLSLNGALVGGGHHLRALTGKVSIEMPPGRLDGASVGPLSLRMNAKAGHYELERLQVVLPGLVVAGKGAAGPEHLNLHIKLVAADLARTSRALRGFRGLRLPDIAGRGKIELSVLGNLSAPEVRAHAALARLVVDRSRVEGLELEVRVPDVYAPEAARLDLGAASVRVSGRALRNVSIHARSITQRLTVDAHVGGPMPLSLSGAGMWGRRRESFALERFELRTPGADWKLQQTAHLSLRSEHLAVEGLVLRAGNQTVRADLDKQGERLRAHVAIERFDLGALPQQLAPPHVVLAGRLDVEAVAGGTLSDPTATASVTIRGGRFGRYRDLGLRLEDGRYGHGRASGQLSARGLGTSFRARFDVPTEWPPRDRRAPLELAVTVPETDLSVLRGAFDLPLARRFAGKIALSLQVSGTASSPALRLDTSARGLTMDGRAVGDVSLHVAADNATPATVVLDIQAPRAPTARAGAAPRRDEPLLCVGSLTLRTDLALASFTRRPPTVVDLMRAHFDVSGDLRGLPLDVMAQLAKAPQLTGGTASLRISAEGTASSPTGALNIQVVQATGPRFPPTDARLDAAFGRRDTRLALRVLRGPTLLLSASGVLGLASRQLGDRAALVRAPVTVRASLGPLRLHRDEVPGAAGVGVSGGLTSQVSASLSIDGTLERPVAKMTAALKNTRLGTRALGGARASITYASREADASVELTTPASGELSVKAHSAVDLGYVQLARGLDPRQIPLDASLTARRFELSWLSDLSTEVRKVSGQLSATLRARGVMADPRVSGQLAWVNGGLTLTGLGVYRDIHLEAHGDERAVWIDDLRLASGSGTARLTARAARAADGMYAVESSLNLRRFPIYGQGQPLASVSADAHLTGDASSAGAKVRAKISEAHVELTDAKQKDLQRLGRPSDLILLDGDQPVDAAEATKLEAALAEMKESASPSPQDAQPSTPAQVFDLQLAVAAPRNLWINGKDAALELGLEPGFRVEAGGSPRIYGQVVVRRGRIDIIGRRFDLQAGSVVNFIGPPDATLLDVSAKYFNETENIHVRLTAKGPLDHLAIAVSSPDRPDLTEGQLYTLIVTGRLQLGGNGAASASAAGEAASLVGGLVAAQLQKALAKKLPLDVLTLQAGEGLTGSRLEAGTYLTSKLYAGYVGRVGADPALLQNRNAVHVEYQLNRRWSFDGEYGDVGTGSADLTWKKHY